MRTRAVAVLACVAVLTGIATIAAAFSTHHAVRGTFYGKLATGGDPDAQGANSQAKAGLGPASYDAYLAAAEAYPAAAISPATAASAENTFAAIAAQGGNSQGNGPQWQQVGPTQNGTQPGVTAFSGATNNTASRITALVVSPDCGKGNNGNSQGNDNNQGNDNG